MMTRNQTVSTRDVSAQLDLLFRHEFVPMVRLATLMCGNQHVAEELVMDAFGRLASTFTTLDNPPAYLRRSVINAVYSHQRSHIRERKRHEQVAVPEGVWDPETVGLWECLESLKPEERDCIVLRYAADFTTRDIADALDMPDGTVKSHLHRGLAALRDLYGPIELDELEQP